jgi:uncharacterized protein YndB with AHSA1/START domain
MLTARFNLTIDAPIERVWALLIDYEGYTRFPRVESARVVETGADHPAGVGALREIRVDGVTFDERIVEFEPSHVLAYKIESSRPIRIAHDIGRMTLTDRGGRTELDWVTTFGVDIPVLGPALTYLVRAKLTRTFWEILHWVKADLEQNKRVA